MPLSPVCLVSSNGGSFLPTAGGIDVEPGATVSIKLASVDATLGSWFQIIGTDELTPLDSVPLTGVHPTTHLVSGTVATFVFPTEQGRAVGFRSEVVGTVGGGPIATTFGVYSLTTFDTRVGFVTETREGDTTWGWATKLNPLIRSGGGGGGGPDNYTLTLVETGEDKTVPINQTMLFEDDVVIEEGGNLIVEGDITAIRTENNDSVLYVPLRSERVVQKNDEMLFTSDMTIDGQLTVDGQIVDASPYDGNDVLSALTEVAPGTSAILGVEEPSPVSFLTPAQARTVMDVPSFAEMNAVVAAATAAAAAAVLQQDPVVKHGHFTAQVNHIHYIWADDTFNKTATLPAAPANGDRLELIGVGTGLDSVGLDTDFIFDIYFSPGRVATTSDPRPQFLLTGLHLALEFKTNASTGAGADAWYVTNNGLNAAFGGADLATNSALVSDYTGAPQAVPLAEGQLLFRAPFDVVSGHTPSALVPFSTSVFEALSGPQAFTLAPNVVNRYRASSGLTLLLPISPAQNDEVEIKEVTPDGGTAPFSVMVDTNTGAFTLEKIGLGSFALTDQLTEFKTWIKYKFDGTVWRIVGAAYQLP